VFQLTKLKQIDEQLARLKGQRDELLLNGRRRDGATVACIIESVIGRRITRAEALKIARQIMERAEKERLQLAMWEGQRGIRWETRD
jgi:Lhr-like helicase